MRKLILKNKNNEIARVFLVEKETFEVVIPTETNRLEIVSDIKELKDQKIDFTSVTTSSLSELKKRDLKIGKYGTLTIIDDRLDVSPSYKPVEESNE
ncbi:MAG: hypothetical protein KDD25_10105, partial [Bdellovibrionales bacterium]|nr:hypothetical protein [Bdellovibrionales bacterium]